jgi:hypothetical protein
MRILALSSILLVSFYFLAPKSKEVSEIDSVKMKLSSVTREKKQTKARPTAPRKSQEVIVYEEQPSKNPHRILADEGATLEHVEEDPGSEYEKGWQEELSQVISYLEPEYGEEKFNAYVTERNDYQSTLSELISKNQMNHDLEYLISELEMSHEERVKEIFGRHYEEIKHHQYKFLESFSYTP